MARIAGIDLPREKRIEIGLTYIYGIGRKSAQDILKAAGVDGDIRVKDLTTAVSVTVVGCPSAVREQRPTLVPARVPRRPLRTRRSKGSVR